MSPTSTVSTPGETATEVEVLARARYVAAQVRDPELPVLTLLDLGVLRDVALGDDGRVRVTITPTYSGCPAMATMRDDLVHALADAGLDAEVVVSLRPAWTTDWITEAGRSALREHGISPPGPAPSGGPAGGSSGGPVLLQLLPQRRALTCPQCGSRQTELTSEFGPTACTALYRCASCLEPFSHVKEL